MQLAQTGFPASNTYQEAEQYTNTKGDGEANGSLHNSTSRCTTAQADVRLSANMTIHRRSLLNMGYINLYSICSGVEVAPYCRGAEQACQ
jgi:hypothetical protein